MRQRIETTHEIIKRTLIVFKRANSDKWQCRYRIKDEWIRCSTNEYTLESAIQSANMILIEAHVREKLNVAPVSKKFRDVAKLAIQRIENEIAQQEGKAIYKDYTMIIKSYLMPVLGNISIEQIKLKELDALEKFRIKKMGKVPKRSTILNHNAALKRVFDEAVMHGFMTEAQRPMLVAKGAKCERRVEFSMEEIKIMLSGFDSWIEKGKTHSIQLRYLLKDYVITLLDTGARPGRELFELKWSNVKFANEHNLIFNIQMSKTGERRAIAREPTIQALRRIAQRNFDMTLEEMLNANKQEHIFRYTEFCSKRNGKLNQTPKMVKPSSFFRMFVGYLKEMNLLVCPITLKSRSFYSIRHTYATFALTYDNVNIHTLAKQMGTSVVMIEKHYSHLDAVKAIEQLSGLATRKLMFM
jgi:integrase